MPRHTHKGARQKHSRAHIRYHYERVTKKRYQRAKAIWGSYNNYEAGPYIHPDDIRRNPDAYRFEWPFSYHKNEWSRNPHTRCSCGICSYDAWPKVARGNQKVIWKQEEMQS